MKNRYGKLLLLALILVLPVPCSLWATGVSEPKNVEIEFPSRPLQIIVPFGAGGQLDVKTRFVAKYLGEEVGVPVAVENRAGAGGVVAAIEYLTEKPNTHNLISMALSITAVSPVYREVPYRDEDFVPIIAYNYEPFGLFVNPKTSGIDSFKGLLQYGKSKVIKFGSTGPGSDTYLIQAALFEMAGVKAVTITQASLAEGLTNTLGGHLDVTLASMALAKGFVEEGSLVPIAAYTSSPYTGYGGFEVPTVRSLGYDIEWGGFTYLATRGGTDSTIIDKLHAAVMRVYANPKFKAEMAKINVEMEPMNPQEIIAYSRDKADLVRRLNALLPK